MKRIPTGVAVLISLFLVLFGIVYGTVRGIQDDRSKAEALLTRAGGLNDVLFDRGADGLNLCQVARRHLAPQDEAIVALEQICVVLMSETETLAQKKQANDALQPAFERVWEKTAATATCQSSQRDGSYLEMLSRDLAALRVEEIAQQYNQAASSFNEQRKKAFEGYFSALFRIEACALFE